ncbi:MAG: hypothetical protein AAB590_00690 [Patescibacteria group bacterium]
MLNSDHIEAIKRTEVGKVAKKYGASVVYLRVLCERDVLIGRTISAWNLGEFYEGASSVWKGKEKPAVVKLREFWRRTPHHYDWKDEGGGTWVPKKLKIAKLITLDTTDGKTWKKEVTAIAKKLLSQ